MLENMSLTRAEQVRAKAHTWLKRNRLNDVILGLPEVDDRYHVWRVPLLTTGSKKRLGELVISARTGRVDTARSSSLDVLRKSPAKSDSDARPATSVTKYAKSPTSRLLVHGASSAYLAGQREGSVDLVFTSPPYYNARPEYADYSTYDEYLQGIREVVRESHRVLGEGRFFVMNISPVLVRRENRNSASKRIAVPFDMHRILQEEGFEFIDHILWVKPEGAGWATGRGRRFAADRNPLQYKAVPVTEDILVYRKATSRLIDWSIRTYPDQEAVKRSKIDDGYERTNLWRIHPASDKRHPAIFPEALAERVIRYYSFEGDTVLDPYAGLGTTGRVAQRLNRGFVMVERDNAYFRHMKEDAISGKWGAFLDGNLELACATAGRHNGCKTNRQE